MARQCKLLEAVLALGPPRGFAGRLHRGQEQGDQHTDDGDDDEQLNQRKAARKRGSAHKSPAISEAGREARSTQ
jgi:hypothetical protein